MKGVGSCQFIGTFISDATSLQQTCQEAHCQDPHLLVPKQARFSGLRSPCWDRIPIGSVLEAHRNRQPVDPILSSLPTAPQAQHVNPKLKNAEPHPPMVN